MSMNVNKDGNFSEVTFLCLWEALFKNLFALKLYDLTITLTYVLMDNFYPCFYIIIRNDKTLNN